MILEKINERKKTKKIQFYISILFDDLEINNNNL